MPKARLETLQSGMVVLHDVKNMDGMLLIPAGCVLTEKHVYILNAWGVPEVEVEASDELGEPDGLSQALPPETMKELTDDLNALFWDPSEGSAVQREVFDLVLRRKVRQVLAQ
jgi:hypothetical protein